jgi:hypothetical protein
LTPFKYCRVLDTKAACVSTILAQISIFEVVNDGMVDGYVVEVYGSTITEIGIVPNTAV